MDCIDCKSANPESNRYCGQCGAQLGRSLIQTVKTTDIRDREAIEIQIAESVGTRLIKWGGVIGVVLALLLGKTWYDLRAAAGDAKANVEAAVQEVKTETAKAEVDIAELRQRAADMKGDYSRLHADLGSFRERNRDIEKMQKELKSVQGQVIDLGKRELRVDTLRLTREGPLKVSVSQVGCTPSPLNPGDKVAYCVEGSPPFIFQFTPKGEKRPISSRSPVGFQDASTAVKPPCTADWRGTFYVEKGDTKASDKPFICIRKSDNTYAWIQLIQVP
jgi:hypothetical protein